jgi:hypothetical protein
MSAPAISKAEGGGGRRKRAAALSRLRPEEEESRAGQAGSAERSRPSQEGEIGWLGRKEGGHDWAENRSWAKVQEIKSF